MWMVLAACHRAPPPDGGPPVEETGTPPTGETSTSGETGSTGDTGETGAHTGEPPAGDDPFLSGDPADLIALFELTWYPVDEPLRWAVLGSTFRPGSWRWSGSLDVVADAPDACEVRSGDPELVPRRENFGAVDLYSGVDHVFTTSPLDGLYFGQADLADLDVRGRTWDFVFEGSFVPYFELPAAITFPTGTLALASPGAGAVVPAGGTLEFQWSGVSTDLVELSLLGSDGTRVRCAAVDDGAFDVPPALLAHLPPGEVSYGVYARNVSGPTAGGSGWVQLYATQAIEGTFTLQ